MATKEDLRIRLIQLQPQSLPPEERPVLIRHDSKLRCDSNEDSDPISCTIFSTPLSSAPPYKALSYTWGDPSLTTPILLNGKPMEVTINLEAALRHIAATLLTPLTIWIDAICINQQDENEKSEQVGRMRDIYSQAEEVITWLGQSKKQDVERSRLALHWIERFGGRAKELGIGETPEMLLKLVLERSERGGSSTEELEFATELKRALSSETNPRYDELVGALQDILQRPYWSRIWVVQEVRMAVKVTFMSADGTVDMTSLHHALRLLRNFRHWQLVKLGYDTSGLALDSQAGRGVLPTNPSHAIDLLKASRNPKMSMMSLLNRLHSFKASDPRDQVFALLGLANDVERLGMKVDYSLTVAEVYTQLARALIRRGHFDVLPPGVHNPDRNRSQFKVPSWVRDWTTPLTCAPLQQRALNRYKGSTGGSTLQPGFCASGNLAQADMRANCPDSTLSVQGILVGKVTCVGEPSRSGDLGHWLQNIQSLTSLVTCRHRDPEERSRAVWKTAVADQTVRSHRDKPRLSDATVDRLKEVFSESTLASIQSQSLVENGLGHYAEQMHSANRGRRPFLISSGHLCIGPETVSVEDHVFILLGAGVPYALRSNSMGTGLLFVGEAYVYSCMDGEEADESAAVQQIEIH